MKKLEIALVLSLLIVSGCTSTSSKKKNKSKQVETSDTSALTTSDSPTSSVPVISSTVPSTTTQSTSTTPSHPLIEDLEVSAYKDTFVVGDEFYFGGTVLAVYDNGEKVDVTDKATFSGFDSSEPTDLLSIIVTYSDEYSTGGTNYFVKVVESSKTLGKQTIAYIKKYIEDHPISVPAGKHCAIDSETSVTFDGVALEYIDLVKASKDSGLQDSYRYKVFFGDETGYIAATGNYSQGTVIYKVHDHVGKSTSKYRITGHLSVYLGHPEIVIDEVETAKYGEKGWDQNLPVTCDPLSIAYSDLTIQEFFPMARDNEYNISGHGYGEIYRFNNVTCYYSNAGDDQYYVTDGTSLLKVVNNNRSDLTEGKVYNIAGLLSVHDYSGAIYLESFQEVSATPVELDTSSATEKSIVDLRKVKTSQKDDETRYPDYTMFWSGIYKATGYFASVLVNGNYYIGFRDEYYSGTQLVSFDTAQTTQNIAMIKNENFWNVKRIDYNPYYDTYVDANSQGELVCKNVSVEVFYIPQQLEYTSGETKWKIWLLPSTFPMVY